WPRARPVPSLRPRVGRRHCPQALRRERRRGLRDLELPLARRSDPFHARHKERRQHPGGEGYEAVEGCETGETVKSEAGEEGHTGGKEGETGQEAQEE